MTNAEEVLVGLDATTEWQEELYKQLHAHPELSSHDSRTAAEIARRLVTFGWA